MAPTKVLVVDDRALYRKILRDVVNELPGARTVGTAVNGENAIQEVARLRPDLVLLDVEMPVMDGLTALKHLRKSHPKLPVVMVSSPSKSAADMTMQALQEGAVDFIEKPAGVNPADSRRRLLTALRQVLTLARREVVAPAAPKPVEVPAAVGAPEVTRDLEAKAAAPGSRIRVITGPDAAQPAAKGPVAVPAPTPAAPAEDRRAPEKRRATAPSPAPRSHLRVARAPRSFPDLRPDLPSRISVLAIGTSTGGPAALTKVIPLLPANLPVPVVVVQHMPAGFTKSLAGQLDGRSELAVVEAAEGDDVVAGRVFIAPGGRHMEVVKKSGRMKVRLHDGDPVHNCRPSVDVLFESLASSMDSPVLSLIMTGMGDDGSDGVEMLSRKGSYNLSQDEASCVVYGMPRAVAERGVVHEVLSLERIAPRIREILALGGARR